jgi:hypothetical protein
VITRAILRKCAAKTPKNPLQNALSDFDGQGDPPEETPSQIAKKRPSARSAENALADVLEDLFEKSLAEAAAEELDSHAETAEDAEEKPLKNSECRAEDPATCRTHGTPAKNDQPKKTRADKAVDSGDSVSSGSTAEAATDEDIKNFLSSDVKDFDVETVDALLMRGFEITDGAGNRAHFGTRMKKHLEDHNQAESDRRKRRLRAGVHLVSTTAPVVSARDANVSCYFGMVKGKNYLVMADNTGEVFEIWDQFRRDKWQNK